MSSQRSRETPRQRRARLRRDAWNAEARRHIRPWEPPSVAKRIAEEGMEGHDDLPEHLRRRTWENYWYD